MSNTDTITITSEGLGVEVLTEHGAEVWPRWSADGLTMTSEHDLPAYRQALRVLLDVLDRNLTGVAGRADAQLLAGAFFFRASRLLRGGMVLVESDAPVDGVPLLARGAYEAAIDGAWLLGDDSRVTAVEGALTRRQLQVVREVWPNDATRPERIGELADALAEVALPARIPTLQQRVKEVAEWVVSTEPVYAYVLPTEPGGIATPIRHSGELVRIELLSDLSAPLHVWSPWRRNTPRLDRHPSGRSRERSTRTAAHGVHRAARARRRSAGGCCVATARAGTRRHS